MTPERKAELLTFADGIGADSWIGATVVELLNEIIKLELDLIETRGNYDARAEIADRDRAVDALTARTSELLGKVAALEAQHDADAARIAGLEAEANRRLVERDARIDEVAAEAQAERAKRERIEAAASEVLRIHDDNDDLIDNVAMAGAISDLRASIGGAQ